MLISLLILVIVVGLLIYLVQILPLPDPFRTVAMVLIVLVAIIWLLQGLPAGPLTHRGLL